MSIEFVLTVGKNKISNSLLIALFKLIGTTAATVLNGILNWNSGVLWCGGCCLILDMWYIICLVNKQKEVEYEKNGSLYCGTAVEITEMGGLAVELSDGTKDILQSGEISLKKW